jgi:hypothetical protein
LKHVRLQLDSPSGKDPEERFCASTVPTLGFFYVGFSDFGFSDFGFSDFGFSEFGFSDFGFSDFGFSDFGFSDLVFQILVSLLSVPLLLFCLLSVTGYNRRWSACLGINPLCSMRACRPKLITLARFEGRGKFFSSGIETPRKARSSSLTSFGRHGLDCFLYTAIETTMGAYMVPFGRLVCSAILRHQFAKQDRRGRL